MSARNPSPPLNVQVEAELRSAIELAGKNDTKPGAPMTLSRTIRVLLWEALTARGIAPPAAL